MYKEHFNLSDLPFSIAPNPRYLYLTHQHQEALAHLVYGLNSAGGVILLTGEVGTGKTTISRKLLEDIPDNIVIAWIVNPRLSVEELLAAICDELSISYPADNRSIKIFTDLISDCLIFAHGLGHNVVLIIDEAQNLSPEVLEQLRLLTNLETSERKLLQIVLIGQPELKTMLERSDLRQLAQRITARYHLHPLNRQETIGYIRHRLAVGGCSRPVFSSRAMKLIHRISHGTPRLINLLCDRAMLGVYSAGGSMVVPKYVRQASEEVLGKPVVTKHSIMLPIAAALLLMVTVIFATGTWKQFSSDFTPERLISDQSTSDRIIPEILNQQQSTMPPSPAPKANTPAKIMSDLTEPETQQAAMPEPAEKTVPKAEPDQRHQPELTAEEHLKTTPVQASEMVASANIDGRNTSPPNAPVIESEKQDAPDKPNAIEQDKAMVQVPVGPWYYIEKNGSKLLSFQTLADLWHSTVMATGGEPCHQLSNGKLACLEKRANIWLIRRMNRPAIFRTAGQDGTTSYGVLRFISHDHAVIQLGKQQWRIKLSEFKQRVQDPITVIWFKPPGYQHDLQQGDSGKTVEWLASQLDHIQGAMIPARQTHTMDDILVERLKDFQRSEKIKPDGIAGVLTLMRINKRVGLNIPRLLHRATN